MDINDIKEFELGEHCFGEILRVNGKDYQELDPAEVIKFINDMFLFQNNINASSLIKDTFKMALEYLQFDYVDGHSDSCDQCGNYNTYSKHVIPKD